MSEAFRNGLAWYKFKKLEREFLDATLYFPFEKKHEDIWSEFFSDLLVKIGNSCDSFFRIMLQYKKFEEFPHVRELKQRRQKKDINYFREFFEPIYQLSGVEVEIRKGPEIFGKCSPFKEFKNSKIPEWWTSYNHVKHQWFERMNEATLGNSIDALCGLFVLNILHKESQKYLVKHTNVFTSDYPKVFHVSKYLEESMIGVPKSVEGYGVSAETPLFIHFLRVDEDVKGSWVAMDPQH